MKKNEPYKDRGLRLAVQHKNESSERMALPEDFTDRLMQRIEQKEEQPRHRRMWLYTAIGAVAASILLLLTFHYSHHSVETEKGTVLAQSTEQPKQPSKLESPSREEQRPSRQTEQQDDIPVKTKKDVQTPLMAQEKSGVVKPTAVGQLPNTASVIQKTSTNISTTDSLDYYIDKIERELAQVDESLYIEKMNKVIRADERLQRMVSSYILHNLDKEGRPQTADNIYNEKTEQDEE